MGIISAWRDRHDEIIEGHVLGLPTWLACLLIVAAGFGLIYVIEQQIPSGNAHVWVELRPEGAGWRVARAGPGAPPTTIERTGVVVGYTIESHFERARLGLPSVMRHTFATARVASSGLAANEVRAAMGIAREEMARAVEAIVPGWGAGGAVLRDPSDSSRLCRARLAEYGAILAMVGSLLFAIRVGHRSVE